MIHSGKHGEYFTSRLKFYSQTSCKKFVQFREELVIDNRTVYHPAFWLLLNKSIKYSERRQQSLLLFFAPKTITDFSILYCCKQPDQTTLLQALQLSSELIT